MVLAFIVSVVFVFCAHSFTSNKIISPIDMSKSFREVLMFNDTKLQQSSSCFKPTKTRSDGRLATAEKSNNITLGKLVFRFSPKKTTKKTRKNNKKSNPKRKN